MLKDGRGATWSPSRPTDEVSLPSLSPNVTQFPDDCDVSLSRGDSFWSAFEVDELISTLLAPPSSFNLLPPPTPPNSLPLSPIKLANRVAIPPCTQL